jgi:hypothetical protein
MKADGKEVTRMSETKHGSRMARRQEAERKQARNRRMVLTLCLMLVVCLASVGGTLAWLKSETTPVVNTFSPSNIGLTLTETQGTSFQLIPGKAYAKDPQVTITNDVKAWLFVKLEATENLDDYVSYTLNSDGWTMGDGTSVPANVMYRTVEADASQKTFYLLEGGASENLTGQVTIKTTVTKENMPDTDMNLVFTAYAIQYEGFGTVEAAWTEASAQQ